MAESKSSTEPSDWITIGGKKIEIKPGEDAEDKTREPVSSVRGEKEKNTKEALAKTYVKRYDLIKAIFNSRDEVVFDEYKKSGVVAGIDGGYLKILSDSKFYTVRKETVFKKSDLIDRTHWDTMSKEYRLFSVEKAGLDKMYINRNWINFQPNIRKLIQKTHSPAGYESTSSGIGNPVYTPLNEDKTVSQRIKEEESKQKEEDNDDKTSSTD